MKWRPCYSCSLTLFVNTTRYCEVLTMPGQAEKIMQLINVIRHKLRSASIASSVQTQ
ncbi:hypothetical protein DAQ1742_00533 [Dickeya aquatica]|uniref:Uncharacterized protein n=1 Tax=Dickeya aquatica TaxID=1401087 RepID=A0A375A6L6_9GAMM|nr:hypothetical protein DAQ1742_00533 [Dickeya aquatica]